MTVEFTCSVCGVHVRKQRSPANMLTPPRFCSQKCRGVGVKGIGPGRTLNHVFTCQQCGALTSTYRSPRRPAPRFCSLACLGASQNGSGNPSFSGGRHTLANGYIVVLAPSDPEADSRGYVYEHRLVARGILGRPLVGGEVVHHIDGDKTNNAPDNLQVFTSQSEHMRHHYVG